MSEANAEGEEFIAGNILLVDDVPNNLRVLSTLLTQKGYKVRSVISGEMALKAAQSAPPDLILLDISMPRMDGYEVCRRLKQDDRTRDIPVIFISALTDVLDKVKAFAVGGVDYIPKPFQFAEVLVRVENQLRLRNLQNMLKERNTQLLQEIQDRTHIEEELRQQKARSEQLLLNILPEPIAKRLQEAESTIADNFDNVTVLFADLVNFTQLSTEISSIELVEILNTIFSEFDYLAKKHGLEKIKTIGDAYMAVSGLPFSRDDHAQVAANMALDLLDYVAQFNQETGKNFELRIGMNTGGVVAGVIGVTKFGYDLWGDTVNVASRMESQGNPSKIQVTATTYERLKDDYIFEPRGEIEVKGKGKMMTYWLLGKK
ncbi:adenylate/guanylate cyclase domain-containing protein [Spirulina sp. CS-785/01]|uniref:adenylate/guanylate cyclase domain-containing protein n=1 Tax=Spirulina sp. CS-785/01 TaxID=3021716 RepID=UPI00232F37D8|nr:adenylate/guanylate cyclase domain-containing protein [Spirulina sp. CS-785/01]MDB9314420.1 adenylate/guanylate cyclase domain-containing protein [Spirulina sp. CS-785/01]